MLQQARQGSAEAWERMHRLYQPFIHGWLRRLAVSEQETPDLCQDILTTLVEKLADFQHNGQPRAFRAWLRTVTVNRARLFWRARIREPQASGGAFLKNLDELEDPASGLHGEWDRSHRSHILQTLLDRLAGEFEPVTLEAFRRLGLRGEAAPQVAAALGLSVGAVYIAKSRVLRRLREEAADLLD
jgi:RNA polymerase sigma-70 factor (ECF subfamily)